jgi:hypothetical protein
VAERALVRLITGLADIDDVDIDDYLRHYKETQEYHGLGTYSQLFASHPIIPKRVDALRLFAQSEKYYRLSGKTPPAGAELLTDEELDRRVQKIVLP